MDPAHPRFNGSTVVRDLAPESAPIESQQVHAAFENLRLSILTEGEMFGYGSHPAHVVNEIVKRSYALHCELERLSCEEAKRIAGSLAQKHIDRWQSLVERADEVFGDASPAAIVRHCHGVSHGCIGDLMLALDGQEVT